MESGTKMLRNLLLTRLFLAIEFFLNNTNLTLLTFFVQNLKFQNLKLPPLGIELTTPTNLWIRILMPYPLSQSVSPCQSQTFRPLWSHALLNLKWSKFSSRIFYSTDILGGWMSKAVRILINRWLVLWVRFPVEAIYFCWFCTKIPEMSDLCY